MRNWILSSSVLILGIVLIRRLFRGKMKLNVQYALWGLVLLRLLVPFNLGHSALSLSNFEPLAPLPEIREENPLPAARPVVEPQMQPAPRMEYRPQEEGSRISGEEIVEMTLTGIWVAGALAVGGMFVCGNLNFLRKLKRSRHLLRNSRLPVYVTNRIESPCLFGILHPAVYVTGEVAADPTVLRHTLAHERSHYRHKDHIWAALRGLCLVIHWYNPLVWWAAILSQRDAEMACDESTIRTLGEGQRKEYGKTLIHVSCQKNTHLLTAATTMTSDKKVLKERIVMITKKPKTIWAAMIGVVLLSAIFVGCTFTGAKEPESIVGLNTTEPTSGLTVTETISQTTEEEKNQWMLDFHFPEGYTYQNVTAAGCDIYQGNTRVGGVVDITNSAAEALAPENLAEGEGLTAVLRDEVMPQIAEGEFDYMVSSGIDGVLTDASFANRETVWNHSVFRNEHGYYDLWVDTGLVDFQVIDQMIDAVLHPGKMPEPLLAQKLGLTAPEGLRLFDSKQQSCAFLKGFSDQAGGIIKLDLSAEALADPSSPEIQAAIAKMGEGSYIEVGGWEARKGDRAPVQGTTSNAYHTYEHNLLILDSQVYDLWFVMDNTTQAQRDAIWDMVLN